MSSRHEIEEKLLPGTELVRDRYRLFMDIHRGISEDELYMVKAMTDYFFEPGVYERRYCDNDVALRRFIFFYRYYVFCFFCWIYSASDDPTELFNEAVEYDRAIREKCELIEFRDVHHRQKHYYPGFRAYIESRLKETQHRNLQRRLRVAYAEQRLPKKMYLSLKSFLDDTDIDPRFTFLDNTEEEAMANTETSTARNFQEGHEVKSGKFIPDAAEVFYAGMDRHWEICEQALTVLENIDDDRE